MNHKFNLLLALLIVCLISCASENTYKKVSPSDLDFRLKASGYSGIVDPDGVKPTGGTIVEFFCEGHVLELESNQFEGGFVSTKDYGKIKIRFPSSLTSGGSFTVWLTGKQKKALKELKQKGAK
jgi:hypothetical protein